MAVNRAEASMFNPALVSPEEAAARNAELAGCRAGRVKGASCPHCGVDQVKRWGRLARRPRYRCRGCGRTFTLLTGSPQAYSKYQHKWAEMRRCLVEGLSVRRTAARLGVDPSTAFRWRHRLLAPLARQPGPVLSGIVEVVEAYYPDCHKGERNLPRPARRRGVDHSFRLRSEGICMILATDREGRRVAEPGCFGVPRAWALGAVLCQSLAEGSVVCTERLYWYKDFFRRVKVEHREVRDISHGWIQEGVRQGWWRLDPSLEVYNIHEAVACRRRLLGWLWGFRGVAMKYLGNYLAWFRFLERLKGLASGEAGERLLAEATDG